MAEQSEKSLPSSVSVGSADVASADEADLGGRCPCRIIVGVDGKIVEADGSVLLLGADAPSALIGHDLSEFLQIDENRGAMQPAADHHEYLSAVLSKDRDAHLVLSRSALAGDGGGKLEILAYDLPALARICEERARLASIIAGSHPMVELNRDLVIVSCNPEAQKLYEFADSEVVGHPLSAIVVAGDVERVSKLATEVVEGNRRLECDARLRNGVGKSPEVHALLVPIHGCSRECEGLAAHFQEVGTQRALEEQLHEAHAYTRGLIESSVDAMVVVSPDVLIRDVNEQTVKLTGVAREQLIGSRFEAYFTEPASAAAGVTRTLSAGYVTNYELTLKRADGALVPVSFNASVFHDLAGNVSGVFAVARDATQQRGLEHKLSEAQAYTRGLIESSVDAMVVVSSDLLITDVNEQMARLTEVPKSTLVGSRFDAYFTDPERAAAAVRKTLSDGYVTDYDLNLQKPNGQERLVSFNASVFRDSAGEVRGVFAAARDVTEQRRVEGLLREQQLYGRSLIESAVDALFAIDKNGNMTDVNEQTCKITGYAREELIGASFPVLFTEPARAEEAIRKTLEAGLVQELELFLRTRSGAEIPVSLNASLFRGVDGQVKGVLATAHDISEQQRRQQETALLASIVTSSTDAVYSHTPDFVVTSWNKAAERLYGYTAEEMIGHSMAACIPLNRRKEALEMVRRLGAGEELHFESTRIRKDGAPVDVSVTMSPIRDRSGTVTAVAVIGRDMRERRRFEEELKRNRDVAVETAELKSEFLANMSHEIRTPLNAMLGLAGLMRDTPLTSEQVDLLHDVEKSGEALLSVINDVLDFSKMSAGKLLFEEVDFDLTTAVEDTVELVAESSRAKHLELMACVDPEVPSLLRGDPARLRQVLLNLLSNAVKFTDRGDVAVRVSKISESPSDAMLRFEVRDTGIGITREAQKMLFQPFTQLDPTSRRRHGGTGLGLAIAAQLVKRMNGDIGVLSTPGAGSTFWFTVRLGKQAGGETARAHSGASLAGVRTLAVDDNANNRELIRRMLTGFGMEVDLASDAKEGLATLRARVHDRPYHVAVLDMEMPDASGLELARWIRNDATIAPTDLIIASSAGRQPEQRERAAALGIEYFLLKPLKQSELFDALIQIVSGKHPSFEELSATERENITPAELPGAAESKVPAQSTQIGAPLLPEPGIAGAERRPIAGRHILVVEDNAINLKVALRQLAKLGYKTDGVSNGEEALAAVAKVDYDAILMDCQMPEMDGYETARAIRWREQKAGGHIPIIAMTAHALEGDRERCLEAGMDDYISKPVNVAVLSETLARCLSSTPLFEHSDRANAPQPPPQAT